VAVVLDLRRQRSLELRRRDDEVLVLVSREKPAEIFATLADRIRLLGNSLIEGGLRR